jgi:16S rRNA (cytidine1402-2'-O)-methyltransferase
MLYIVATPLGNLSDLSPRAKEILSNCELIIAENPSHSRHLFDYFELPKKRFAQFAEHNEESAVAKIVKEISALDAAGKDAALISDAGMPGISDPGFRVVRAALAENIKVSPIPGPSAAVSALAASGLPTDKFVFFGFLPKTEVKVVSQLEQAKNIQATAVFYESPQRIVKTLGFIAGHFPEAKISVARELTKIHEEFVRGGAEDVVAEFKKRPSIKGEITVVVSFK